jgi:peptidoglycan hydrolase-like protein with peptidoglycan-binding domain
VVRVRYIADLLAIATEDNGDQWTVMKNAGKVPVFKKKDLTTTHWTVVIGQPGVTHDLSRNHTEAPNAFYGEGIHNNCRWRNAVYPHVRPDDAPPWPGDSYYPGNTYDSNLTLFKRTISERGFNVAVDNVYHASEEPEIKRFQGSYGGLQSGIIAAQTWAGAFQPGTDAGSLSGGHFLPLVFDESYPWVRQGNGSVFNPNYDPKKILREHYINWGADTHLWTAAASSKSLKEREYPADYIGSITLASDPQEGHRFEIKAGQNILLKSHHGTNRKFHIARAEVDVEGGTVTLQVDEGGRDALTLAEIKKRNTEFGTPTYRQDRVYRNSRAIEDRYPTWDCEVGSGVVPRHGIFRNLWNVLKLPFAAGGEIVRTEFSTDFPSRFAVAVFDRPVTHNTMKSYGNSPLDEGYWDGFGDGLVIAWGGEGQAAGYYPGRESDEDPKTGVLVDDSTWYYESYHAPWLWVAIWCEDTNYVTGRFYPGTFN